MRDILKRGAFELGTELNQEQLLKFEEYARLLVEWNEKMNLTAITDPKEIAVKHFLDSMSALCTSRVGKKVIDVGCGAGFPGLVLKLARPEIELVLLDSLKKRIGFLDCVIEKLGIEGVKTVHMRAEDAGKSPNMRASFDTAVSRAVANMTSLSEWCIPFVKEGGYFLALKGPAAADELNEARRAIKILGGEPEGIFDAKIPQSDLSHKIIIVKKTAKTPMKYPRKPGTKTPIESCYNLK